MDETARQIVDRFRLEPHPEGGYFREVYRSSLSVTHPGIPDEHDKTRRAGTLIYFLLEGDSFSAFHRVKWSDEAWHLYTGGPIELHAIDPAGGHDPRLLSSDFEAGEPTTLVPAGHWQAARLTGGATWAFGGCTVSPGFEFADFEMPARVSLLEAWPQHAELIRSLTRS